MGISDEEDVNELRAPGMTPIGERFTPIDGGCANKDTQPPYC